MPEGSGWIESLKRSSHPMAVIFYLAFRTSALLTYLFGLLFTSNFVLIFILVILLLAADFWTVKNISGRLLVGLRWWNEVSSDGASIWVFETADPQRHINPIDSKVFWTGLYITPALWVGLGLLAILKFEFLWLLLILIALILSVTNALAFSRCDKYGRANSILGNVSSSVTSRLFSGITSRFYS